MKKIIFCILIFWSFMENVRGSFGKFSPFVEELVKSYGRAFVETKFFHTSYSHIIVGSGPGGCVLANRLTSNPKWKVLLIEAGTVETFFQQIPLSAPYHVASRYNWGYLAERQPYACQGLKNEQCGYPRGRALGGTSVINGMLYTRGSKGDFEHWKQLGVVGWDYYENVLPAFKKSENANLRFFHKPEFHNKSGNLEVSSNNFETPLAKIFTEGLKSMGLNEIDFNSDDSIGFGRLQSNTKNGERQSAFEAFIRPILGRKNLHIMLNSRVIKVLIDETTKRAIGVRIVRGGKRFDVKVTKEVILSSGTFHSPQLLMISGIGPKETLQNLSIPLIQDLPVGREMHDHPGFAGMLVLTNISNPSARLFGIFREGLKWFATGGGLVSIPNGAEALAFIKLENSSTPVEDQPDLEIIACGVGPQADFGYGVKAERLKNSIYDAWLKPLENERIFTLFLSISLLHPKSVGFLELKSSNPFDPPRLTSNFLKEPEDLQKILEGVKFIEKLLETPPFKAVDAKFHKTPIPPCEKFKFASENYWRCAIRTFSLSFHHQVGTCKMGEDLKSSVVNSKLKVHGVKNLRVVDTSIVPSATSAHTNSLSYMIGERAAEFFEEEEEEKFLNFKKIKGVLKNDVRFEKF